MNITSWVDAPKVNGEKPSNVPAAPTWLDRHHHARRVRVAGGRGGVGLVECAGALRPAARAAVAIGRDPRDGGVDRRLQPLRERLARAQVLHLAVPGSRERRPEPGRDHQPSLELAVLDARPEGGLVAHPPHVEARAVGRDGGDQGGGVGIGRVVHDAQAALVVPPNCSPSATMISVGRTMTKNTSDRSRSCRSRLTRPISIVLRMPLIPSPAAGPAGCRWRP